MYLQDIIGEDFICTYRSKQEMWQLTFCNFLFACFLISLELNQEKCLKATLYRYPDNQHMFLWSVQIMY